MTKTDDSISLRDLALEAGVSERSLRIWSRQGLPVTQRGRSADGPGSTTVAWLFPRAAALEWIAEHRSEQRERNRQPFADVLDSRDPRHARARQRAQRINDEIEALKAAHTSRPDAYRVAHDQFEQVKNVLFAIPANIAAKVAKLIDGDRQKVEARLRAEISEATAGLVAKAVLPAAPSFVPSDLDDEDDDNDLDSPDRLPRLHPSDPRHKVISLLNDREDWLRSIACGDLIETAAVMDSVGEAYGLAKNLLSSIGGRLSQEFGGPNEVQRQVKAMIENAIYAAYEKANSLSDLDVNLDDEL